MSQYGAAQGLSDRALLEETSPDRTDSRSENYQNNLGAFFQVNISAVGVQQRRRRLVFGDW
jgi:hypothetical protein